MIQIDDSGSGSLVGGTIIGLIRQETYEYYFEVIPIKYFITPYFEKKEYTSYCVKIIERGLKFLNASLNEEISICQGYIFDKARTFLNENGYNYKSTKISEPLQTIIENEFIQYSINLGIPQDFIIYTQYPFHFHRLLKWVFADYENRVPLCKTGWRSWKKYGCVKMAEHYELLNAKNYNCLKCGQKLFYLQEVKVIEFTTNKSYKIYLHKNCDYSLISK